MDLLPWKLVGDGNLIGVTSSRLTIRIPHIATRLGGSEDIVFRLGGATRIAYLPRSDRWDEPDVEDVAAIAALALPLDDLGERNGGLRIRGSAGRLDLAYESLALEVASQPITRDELRAAVRDYWSAWRAKTTVEHPCVRAALREPWTPQLVQRLLAAWRVERTTELATTLGIIDLATRPPAKVAFRGPESVAAWTAIWRDNPSAAIEALAKRARETYSVEAELGTRDRAVIDAHVIEIYAGMTACLDAIDAEADPRIGRALEGMLGGTSDHYFRVDQVPHAIDKFEAPNTDPSFADVLLPLLSNHADAGSASRLDEERRIQLIECDCNGLEMADRLRILVAELRLRYPQDRALPGDAAQALRVRGLP